MIILHCLRIGNFLKAAIFKYFKIAACKNVSVCQSVVIAMYKTLKISQIYLMDHSDVISLKLSEDNYFPKLQEGK